MTNLERTIKYIRPSLRDIAPYTFWSSLGFGLFNTLIGVSLYNFVILSKLELVGVIPMRAWAVIFFLQGFLMLVSLAFNSWKMTRLLHLMGIVVKTAWWLELLIATVAGRSPFLLYVWSLLIFLQIIIYIYFTPRVNNAK